jgi:anti-sigma B factor antagonist
VNIKRKDISDVTVLKLSGKLMGEDASTFQNLIKELLGEGRKKILLDLGGLSWINSTGLGILISVYTSVKNAGGVLKISSVAERIESVLLITKLIMVFETYKTEEEALVTFGGE